MAPGGETSRHPNDIIGRSLLDWLIKQKQKAEKKNVIEYLSKVVQQAGGRPDVGPAAVLPARVQPLVVVGLPRLALDKNHVGVLLGPSQPLGQNAAVALIHKQQNTCGLAAGQVGQQLVDRVSLLEISLER